MAARDVERRSLPTTLRPQDLLLQRAQLLATSSLEVQASDEPSRILVLPPAIDLLGEALVNGPPVGDGGEEENAGQRVEGEVRSFGRGEEVHCEL